MPRIGKQYLLIALKKLVQIVQFDIAITEKELKEKMREVNENNETKIFKDIDEWLSFVKQNENRSVSVIRVREDNKIELTDEGKSLINTTDFRKKAFKLLEKKSKKNFTHFDRVLQEIDKKVKREDYNIGDNIQEWIYTIIKNEVTGGAIICFIKDFEIIYKKDGKWKIDQVEYSRLRGDKGDIVEDIIKDHGRIDLLELEKILRIDFEWTDKEIEKIIEKLIYERKISKDKYEGKIVIEALIK